jgi:hypothetical protein
LLVQHGVVQGFVIRFAHSLIVGLLGDPWARRLYKSCLREKLANGLGLDLRFSL